MWIGIICVVLLGRIATCEPDGIKSDVDVFNKNFNRNQHSAKDLIYRVYEVIPPRPQPTWKAAALLTSDDPEQSMSGEVSFKQWNINSPIIVSLNISGLPPGKHSVHIHAFGDVSDGCKSTGPHFRTSILANIEAKQDENLELTYETLSLNLFGLNGILGRSVVIHEKASEYLRYPDLFTPEAPFLDDAITYQTEEDQVGSRLACGPIIITSNI